MITGLAAGGRDIRAVLGYEIGRIEVMKAECDDGSSLALAESLDEFTRRSGAPRDRATGIEFLGPDHLLKVWTQCEEA